MVFLLFTTKADDTRLDILDIFVVSGVGEASGNNLKVSASSSRTSLCMLESTLNESTV